MSTKAILTEAYPLISKSLDKNTNKFKQMIGRFIDKRHEELYAIAPLDRIYYTNEDSLELYTSLDLDEKEIVSIINKTYYSKIPSFNPRAALDPTTIILLNCTRYFYLKKMQKELELSMIYLSFSGKFYPSIHFSSYPTVVPRENEHIMMYVVNNRLSSKFDLKREGSVINAIKSICLTWISSYSDRLKSFDDEDVVYLIQQLHSRIKSFMQNIAEEFYDVYDNKDSYITYDSDDMSEDSYRLADNDSLRIERYLENTMSHINTTGVDYKVCKMSSDSNVKTDEIKSIIETVLNDSANVPLIKELIRLMITEYFKVSKTKDISDVAFITFTISSKPNTKEPGILRMKKIISDWLEETSPAYRKRKSREATKNSYEKSILKYFCIIANSVNS